MYNTIYALARYQCFYTYKKHKLHCGNSGAEKDRAIEFANWVLNVGDGKLQLPSDFVGDRNEGDILLPSQLCCSSDHGSVEDIVHKTFPYMLESLHCVKYLRERAILTPTNENVSFLNNVIIEKIPGAYHIYLSVDSAEEFGGSDDELLNSFPVEYLNSLKITCLPPHELRLKEGIVVMLMRNLNQTLGLCNGTHMIVRKCLKQTIMCEVITGSYAGTTQFIPRIDMSPTETTLPFKLCQKHMPLQICFVMTINKSQGQSLERVRLFLSKSLFTHGQFYVAVSKVTSADGLSILVEECDGTRTSVTTNVVYDEVFYNLPKL